MKDLTEQIYDELNAQVLRLLDDSMKKTARIVEQATRIAELEAQISASADPDKLREAIPEGWAFDMTSSGHMTVQKKGLGGYLASPDSSNIASSLLFELANDLLSHSTALQAPVREVPEPVRKFLVEVAQQSPEKPDYWSECGQCGTRRDQADELLEQFPAAPVQEPKP